jgi:hypothetical protein
MKISREKLIQLTKSVFEIPMKELGYLYNNDFVGTGWDFAFVKQSKNSDIFFMINMQPEGFSAIDLFDMTVNFLRCNNLDGQIDLTRTSSMSCFLIRITTCLQYLGYGIKKDLWWHFLNEEEAITGLQDMLDKIIIYGIPFLEDSNTNFNIVMKDVYKKFNSD